MVPKAVASQWFDDAEVSPLGEGHIHDTFEVNERGQRYVLQRLNENVFKDGDLVMAQTERLLKTWSAQTEYIAPQLVENKSGATSCRIEGQLWRVWQFIEGARIVDPIESLEQAEAAGAAFGALQRQLQNMAGATFRDTIYGFLQLPYYLKEFEAVAMGAPSDLLRLVEHHQGLATQLAERNAIIHGDCKVNNLLFEQGSDKVAAIIDFDTAMRGHWAWDFGDLVRSICYSRGGCDIDYFRACLRGFAPQQAQCTAGEVVIAPQYVALMLGVRFLTDHLLGDVYFRVARRGQNLHRAQEQFEVFDSFLRNGKAMQQVAVEVLSC